MGLKGKFNRDVKRKNKNYSLKNSDTRCNVIDVDETLDWDKRWRMTEESGVRKDRSTSKLWEDGTKN